MTQSPSPITLLSSTHSSTPSDECHNWICIAREVEHHSQTRNAIAEHPNLPPRRHPSALLMAAGIVTTFLLGNVGLMQIQHVTTDLLTEAGADFVHQNF